jgi:hypothetical protein
MRRNRCGKFTSIKSSKIEKLVTRCSDMIKSKLRISLLMNGFLLERRDFMSCGLFVSYLIKKY